MALTDFKDGINLPEWRILASALNAHGAGVCIAEDFQNNDERFLGVFQLISNTVLNFYNTVNDGPSYIGSPALSGTFGAGVTMKYAPSHGPRGVIAAGATVDSITPSATLGVTMTNNWLSSRGVTGIGFKIRIADNIAGGTGKVTEHTITANSSGTTPKIKFTPALSQAPQTGASFEILGGRLYMLGGGTFAAGSFKYFDMALNIFSGNLSIVNLPAAVVTDAQMEILDELHNPLNRNYAEGFVGKITANACNTTTITTATGTFPNTCEAGGVELNQFRNYQLRIIEDATTPTAVNQRQIIASHTAGTSPVFTPYAAWTVQPSATAKFVIEYPNEIIWKTGSTSTYSYAPYQVRNNAVLTTAGAQADSWSAVRYGVNGGAGGTGMMMFAPFSFPISDTTKDPLLNYRHGKINFFRGAGGSVLDVFDIAGGATGLWTNTIVYRSIGTGFNTGACQAYDPVGNDGRYTYISLNGTQYFNRFNNFTYDMGEWGYVRQNQGAAALGKRLWTSHVKNKTGEKVAKLGILQSGGSIQHECFITT